MRIRLVNGHTEGMMLPQFSYRGNTLVFMADLIPSAAHIPLPYVMAYDTRPLVTLEEKAAFLVEAVRENYILFYEHDPSIACSRVVLTEKGYRSSEPFRLEDL